MRRIFKSVTLQISIATASFSLAEVARSHEGHLKPSSIHLSHQTAKTTRSIKKFSIPSAQLIRDDRVEVDFADELRDPRPVYLNFVYTSCTSVCPVMTNNLAVLQAILGDERDRVRFLSVSIDPEVDTVGRLAEYRRQFDAGPQWRFYTGTTEASTLIQKAFGVFSRDKMNHPVATFYRPAKGQNWVRLDGFLNPEQLEQEYRLGAAQ